MTRLRHVVMALALGVLATGCSDGSLGGAAQKRCIPAGSCEGVTFAAGIDSSLGNAAAGAATFEAKCVECHGGAGIGIDDAREINMTRSSWQARFRDGGIASVVRAGKAPKMPAFKFSDGEMRDLIAHIRTLEVKAAPADAEGTVKPKGY